MKITIAIFFALMLCSLAASAAGPYANTVTYSGQGLLADGFGGYDLNQEICGVVNGAERDGPYLLWVLTATKAKNADITGPWGTAPMNQFGSGTFKYVSGWYSPSTLPGHVSATYDGSLKNAQLTISHGCRPKGTGWCSPGFWRNATDAAWAVVGVDRNITLFNNSVYPVWYGATFVANPSLQTVLNNPPTYSGAPLAGTSGYALNAFNAVGAFLTDKLPGGFNFAALQNDNSDTCPIDHFGNFKN
jgi:hypothetical protein